MAYPSSRPRVAPEFVTAYTVSEVESPAPWNKLQPESLEDNFNVEEVFIAPPLPRRPDYHNGGRNYRSRGSRAWVPSPTPAPFYREEYECTAHGFRVEGMYEYDRRPEGNWRQHRAISPSLSDSSSACSAPDCEECVYMESRRRYGGHDSRRPAKPVPYVIVPGNSIGARRSPSPDSQHANYTRSRAYGHEAPRVYRLHDSVELAHAAEEPPPTREASPTDDDTSVVANSHNQVVLFRGTSGGRAPSNGTSIMHSNVSSPRWSVAGQQYPSGSETQSDILSRSPVTSLDGLYEYPDPRFAHHVHPPPRVQQHTRGPVVITRSDGSYGSDRLGDYDDGEYSDLSGGSERFSSSERSFSSDSGRYYSHGYERRFW
ncbi:hypothetical protein P691DRAFT_773739 [Macrolepiota fuliginosa MF-IS2]|uniref:Uncharacterized protein n=1 Tax=Macrolepiota fuliginosa MF-IS2 TaxID=1400762 RepID=A0A9P6C6A6_9AGAR|nr:hypothetical protein P691DRAFT_773739 [Macrolepiota fuliginosa MF-IS2]